ncbi:hypothetical protein DY000_02039035 [Brassica cretica]|uniref:Secreted protein n=1 Tax=Brassica cretica TaxID=69181 RepID=A0ABQ7B533_BRACR|nr:hypothetical protein DY000_02039035 [Brassica cretica]
MFSVSSSTHRLTLTILCFVGLRSVKISSHFIVIFIAPAGALVVSHAVDGSLVRPSLKVLVANGSEAEEVPEGDWTGNTCEENMLQ